MPNWHFFFHIHLVSLLHSLLKVKILKHINFVFIIINLYFILINLYWEKSRLLTLHNATSKHWHVIEQIMNSRTTSASTLALGQCILRLLQRNALPKMRENSSNVRLGSNSVGYGQLCSFKIIEILSITSPAQRHLDDKLLST